MQNCTYFVGVPHFAPIYRFISREDIHLRSKFTFSGSVFYGSGGRFYIISAWLLGLILGLHIIPAIMEQGEALSPMCFPEHRYFLTWWLSSGLPLLLAMIFVRFNRLFVLPFLCLAKALLFGFSLFILSKQFLSGSWLAMLLFMFPDVVSGCLLLWFLLRQREGKQPHFLTDAAVVLLSQSAVLCLDFYFIAPFVQKLF